MLVDGPPRGSVLALADRRPARRLSRADRGLLRPLLDDYDPAIRQWGATLLARYPDPEIELELATRIVDDDPQVRAAVLKSLTRDRSRFAAPAAVTALADPVWFVRVHAARALGRLGQVDQASELVGLLGDPQWWVRTAAKESLQELGEQAAPAILPALKSDDRFVRDGAAEVLQNIGVVDELIRRLEQSPHDELALRTLRSIFDDGGRAVAGAAMQRAVASGSPHAAELLDGFAQ